MTDGRCDDLHGVVLDIETAPAVDLVAAAAGRAAAGFRRRGLHKVVCASALTYRQDPRTGAFSNLSLSTFTSELKPEASILVGVDLLLPNPAVATARLVTWNGMHHDLPMLRSRAVALWMNELHSLRGWTAAHREGRHLDLMREDGDGRGEWSRLRDVCAGMGIALHAADETMTRALAGGAWDRVAEHNRMDVLGTFLIHAGRESFDRGCPVAAATAWAEVARLTGSSGRSSRHEAALSTHYLVGVAARQVARHQRRQCPCGFVNRRG